MEGWLLCEEWLTCQWIKVQGFVRNLLFWKARKSRRCGSTLIQEKASTKEWRLITCSLTVKQDDWLIRKWKELVFAQFTGVTFVHGLWFLKLQGTTLLSPNEICSEETIIRELPTQIVSESTLLQEWHIALAHIHFSFFFLNGLLRRLPCRRAAILVLHCIIIFFMHKHWEAKKHLQF